MPQAFDNKDVSDKDIADARKLAQEMVDNFAKRRGERSREPLPQLKVPPPLPVGEAKLYTMKITLLDVEPSIWRRFVVPTFMMLDDFHIFLQSIMGWGDAHAYAFTINGNRFVSQGGGIDQMWDNEGGYDVSQYELCQLIKPGMKIEYEYDFGDGWEHEIIVENDSADIMSKHPCYCLEGKRACPPEDCGGPGGYEELLEILSDPDDPEHDERKEWLENIGYENFDSERFSAEQCNRKMGVVKPGQSLVQKKNVDPKKIKQERKRRQADKKRNRKKK